MSLRNLSLKEIYRSDRDDIISEFFVPCLANCIEYSRCVERISAKSLTTIILAIGDDPDTRVRIVSGHRFGAGDIALMNKIFSKDGNRIVNDFIRDTKINRLRQAVNGNHLAVKVAVPNDEEISGIFTERVGIFTDKAGDVVAFTGTSSHTFAKARITCRIKTLISGILLLQMCFTPPLASPRGRGMIQVGRQRLQKVLILKTS